VSTVSEALSFEPSSVRKVESREVITVRGSSLPICDLGRLLRPAGAARRAAAPLVVVAALGNRRWVWWSTTCTGKKTS